MEQTQNHRLTPAEILLVFVLVVAFATTAWAEVTPTRNSPKPTQLSYTQAVALAAQLAHRPIAAPCEPGPGQLA